MLIAEITRPDRFNQCRHNRIVCGSFKTSTCRMFIVSCELFVITRLSAEDVLLTIMEMEYLEVDLRLVYCLRHWPTITPTSV